MWYEKWFIHWIYIFLFFPGDLFLSYVVYKWNSFVWFQKMFSANFHLRKMYSEGQMPDLGNFKLIHVFLRTIFRRFCFIEMWIGSKKGNIELNAQDWCLNMWRLWHKLTKDRKFKVKAVTHAVSHVMEKQH